MSSVVTAFGTIESTAATKPVLSVTRRMTWRLWYFSLAAVGAWSSIIAALISIYVHPSPRVHDEFSYMLAADTILHGRLANPTPPAWEALQSFHTVLQPNYASKYPVGVGLLVAPGMALGVPLASSWFAVALMTISVMWMIAGVLPKRWAILGGVIISLSPFIQLAWSQSLMHGFLPASGSALLMGGVLRLRRRVSFSSAIVSGSGIAMLAISRPFEGLCATAFCALMLWLAWKRHAFRTRIAMATRASAFTAAPILSALVLIASHNHAVTGKWLQMPYQLHESQYGVAPLFVFDSPKMGNTQKRADLPAVFHDYHAIDSLQWYRSRIGLGGWISGINDAARELFKLSFPFICVLAVSGLRWTEYRLTRALLLAIGLQVAASASVCWVYSHYLAPMLPWLLLLCLVSLQLSLKNRSGKQSQLVRLTLFTVVLVEIASIATFAPIAKSNEAQYWSHFRQEIVESLSETEGKHLVLVRYSEKHNVHQEWVYNLADPSRSKIVWARFEDGRWLPDLLNAYPNRTVWVIDADDREPRLKEFAVGLEQHAGNASGH